MRLCVFDHLDVAKTKLIVYFRFMGVTVSDTISTEFRTHHWWAANLLKRTPGGNYATYLANGIPMMINYICKLHRVLYATMKIPGLTL